MIAKIKRYLTLTIIVTLLGIIGYQQIRSWLRGIEHSPIQSVYRNKPAKRPAKPLNPPKGSVASIRPVQGFVAPSSDPSGQSSGQFTIGRWELENIPCNRDVIVEVTANEAGVPAMTYEIQKDGLAELGYLRELALFYSRSIELSDQMTSAQEIGLEYSHDLFRVGPAWVSGRGSIGYEQVEMPDGSKLSGVKATVTAKVGVRF